MILFRFTWSSCSSMAFFFKNTHHLSQTFPLRKKVDCFNQTQVVRINISTGLNLVNQKSLSIQKSPSLRMDSRMLVPPTPTPTLISTPTPTPTIHLQNLRSPIVLIGIGVTQIHDVLNGLSKFQTSQSITPILLIALAFKIFVQYESASDRHTLHRTTRVSHV